MALYVNLRKVWQWGMTEKVLVKTGEMVRAWDMMYTAVVQTVMVYRSETWVVTYVMLKVLE